MGIIFLDIEASGLDERQSYPIEVGWARMDQPQPEWHLILPHPDWLWWDPLAQSLHGVSRSRLFAEGRPGPWIADRMTAAFADATVYADSDLDVLWLNRLFAACGRPVPFQVGNAVTLIETAAQRAGADLEAARRWASARRAVHCVDGELEHRAAPDAAYLRDLYTACLEADMRAAVTAVPS